MAAEGCEFVRSARGVGEVSSDAGEVCCLYCFA